MKGQTLTTRRTPLKTVFSVLTAFMIAVVLLPFMKPQKAEAATNYSLWVMGKQVTSENMSNILGNDAFSYDYGRNTLYVNAYTYYTYETRYKEIEIWDPIAGFLGYDYEPYEVSIPHKGYTFNIDSNNNIIRSYIPDLKIVINDNITFNNSNINYKDYAPINISENNNTISGNGSLKLYNANGNALFIGTGNSLTFDNMYANLEGMNAVSNGGTITFTNSVVSFKGYQNIFSKAGKIVYNESHLDYTSGAKTVNGKFVDANGNPVLEAKIVKGSGIITYDGIKVCGKEVNSANKDDIMGGGEFSYDPDTKTLNIKKTFNKVIDGYPSVIENTGIDGLIINTTGTNCTLSNQSDDYSSPCISISRNTTFKGNRLIVNGNIYGIKVNGSAALTFSSPANAYANDYGIFGSSSASVVFNGNPITATGEIAAVKGFKTITISDSVAVRDMAYYISNGIRAGRRSSSPYATSVTFIKNESYDLWVNGQQVRTSNINDILGDGTSDSHPFGTMWFSPSSQINMLVLDANGRELNVNSITSSIPNFAIVVMSDTKLVPNSPTASQIVLNTNTRINGDAKLTVNNISAYNCNVTLDRIENLSVGDPSKSSSSFLVVYGTGNISFEDSNVYVNGAVRSEKGYINFDKSYIAAPQDTVVKAYKSGRFNDKNAVCVGDSLAHEIKIYKEGTKPEFKTNSMTLGGSISLNFYTDLSKLPSTRYADSYVEFVVNGKKQTAKFDPNKMNKAKTYYGFNCKLNSISMADPINATLYYYDSNGNKQSITTTSSAEDYLRKFNEQLDGGTKTWDLIKGINDYGYYMQQYLSGLKTTTWKLGVDHKAMEKAFATHAFYTGNKSTYISELKGMAKSFGTNKNIQKVNYSLVLDSDTSINFKFKKADGYNGKFTVTVDGKSATPKKLSDGRFQVSVTGIPAHKLNEPHTVKVTTDSGTTTYKASALSYIYECINKPNSDSEYDAMSAMYEYYKAAVAYNA